QSPRSPPRAVVTAAGQSPRTVGQSPKLSSVAAPSPRSPGPGTRQVVGSGGQSPRSPGQIRASSGGQSPRSPGHSRPVATLGQSSHQGSAPRLVSGAAARPAVSAARPVGASFVQHGGVVQRASGSFAPPIRVASAQ
ncbi:unnamed protein product, partial [Symbiodinium microadriaticum]